MLFNSDSALRLFLYILSIVILFVEIYQYLHTPPLDRHRVLVLVGLIAITLILVLTGIGLISVVMNPVGLKKISSLLTLGPLALVGYTYFLTSPYEARRRNRFTSIGASVLLIILIVSGLLELMN